MNFIVFCISRSVSPVTLPLTSWIFKNKLARESVEHNNHTYLLYNLLHDRSAVLLILHSFRVNQLVHDLMNVKK